MHMIDFRGKKMVHGSRRCAAIQARYLRRIGLGNAAARDYIARVAARYVRHGAALGWTAGQLSHMSLVMG